jgi:hypothetical protein
MGYKWNPFTGQLDSDTNSSGNVASAASLQIPKIASEHIFAGECVMAISNTEVALATNDTTGASALVLGIAANDALIGQTVNVLIMGAFTNTAYSVFAINTLLFLDKIGSITDVKPSLPLSNFSTVVGKAIGGNTIFIQIGTPLTL